MAKQLNVGYVGWFSNMHTEYCRTAAVCDINERKVESFLANNPDVRGYTDYREMAADPDLEVAVISVPNHLHCEMASAFLDAGKHVFLEKPMGVNREEMNLLLRTWRESGRQLAIDFECRVSSGYVRAKEILDAGELGELRGAELIHHQGQWLRTPGNEWRLDPVRSGGHYFECICHYVDLMRLWLGEVTHAQSFTMPTVLPQYSAAMPDNITTHLFFESGAHATLVTVHSLSVTPAELADYNDLGHEMYFVVIGTEGAMRLDAINGKALLVRYEEDPAAQGSRAARLNRIEDVSGPAAFHDIAANYRCFFEAVSKGEPHHQDAYDAWHTFAVCLAAEESAQQDSARIAVDYRH